jgi:hypothetical protein
MSALFSRSLHIAHVETVPDLTRSFLVRALSREFFDHELRGAGTIHAFERLIAPQTKDRDRSLFWISLDHFKMTGFFQG